METALGETASMNLFNFIPEYREIHIYMIENAKQCVPIIKLQVQVFVIICGSTDLSVLL